MIYLKHLLIESHKTLKNWIENFDDYEILKIVNELKVLTRELFKI